MTPGRTAPKSATAAASARASRISTTRASALKRRGRTVPPTNATATSASATPVAVDEIPYDSLNSAPE